ncbi:MAG: hypothetical protein PWQ18_1099 [Clostridia bacterium]|nr:hypothetical protein [Clostridia bacterium]
MMTSLRRLSKRRPVLGVLFVVVLSIGLVGSYAIFAAPRGSLPPPEAQAPAPDAAQQAEAMQKAMQEQMGQLETEIANLQKEVQAKPNDSATLLKLGDSQYNLGTLYLYAGSDQAKAIDSFKAAVASYQQVLRLNPQEEGINLRLAGAALYAGDNKLAEDSFQAALKADPGDNNARITYGMYLASLKGDLDGAIGQWQEVLRHNPDQEMAAQVQEMIKQAQAAKQKGSEGGTSPAPASGGQENGK